METQPHKTDEPAADATYPPWLLLNCYGSRKHGATIAGDARTVAYSCTSTGHPFCVSIGLTPPPSCSYLNYTWLGATGPPRADTSDCPTFVAAHGDVLLFELRTLPTPEAFYYHMDYFLYETAGTARPPSLSILPACHFTMLYERHRRRGATAGIWKDGSVRSLHVEDTTVLRRHDGGLLVAQLEVLNHDEEGNRTATIAELCLLTPGGGDWELRQVVPIVSGDGDAELDPDWNTDAAIPVGDRYLCFVDYFRGFLLCDTADMVEGCRRPLALKYVPLPVEPPDYVPARIDRPRMGRNRNLSAMAGGGAAVRFVSVDSRCCCGRPGRTSCVRGRFTFTVTTWTLSLAAVAAGEPSVATWVKEGVLDCEEIWGFFPAYVGIPRMRLEYPIVSPDNLDVVCFTVCKNSYAISSDKKIWTVEVNTRSKEVLSVFPCTIDPGRAESRAAVKLKW